MIGLHRAGAPASQRHTSQPPRASSRCLYRPMQPPPQPPLFQTATAAETSAARRQAPSMRRRQDATVEPFRRQTDDRRSTRMRQCSPAINTRIAVVILLRSCYFAPGRLRSIASSCLCVSLFACSLESQNHMSRLHEISALPVAAARSSFDDNAIRYVLPVL